MHRNIWFSFQFNQRLNPLACFDRFVNEPKAFWSKLIRKHILESKVLTVIGTPSKEEKNKLNKEEQERVDRQIKALGPHGLKQKADALRKAIEANEKEIPETLLTSIPIPKVSSIAYHKIIRCRSDLENKKINLSSTPVFTYFDHVETDFVYVGIFNNYFWGVFSELI